MKKTIGIDFDGTICKKQPYGDGIIYEQPNEGATEVITKLAREYKIVVFTTRLNPGLVKDDIQTVEWKRTQIENWLTGYGVPFDEVTNNKPAAMLYIDDRAVRFTNWNDMGNYLLQ